MDNDSWPPPFVYNGPYPRHQLLIARRILVSSLKDTKDYALEKVKPKIGLRSRFGSPEIPSTIPGNPSVPPGFAESSDKFCKEYGEIYHNVNYNFTNNFSESSQRTTDPCSKSTKIRPLLDEDTLRKVKDYQESSIVKESEDFSNKSGKIRPLVNEWTASRVSDVQAINIAKHTSGIHDWSSVNQLKKPKYDEIRDNIKNVGALSRTRPSAAAGSPSTDVNRINSLSNEWMHKPNNWNKLQYLKGDLATSTTYTKSGANTLHNQSAAQAIQSINSQIANTVTAVPHSPQANIVIDIHSTPTNTTAVPSQSENTFTGIYNQTNNVQGVQTANTVIGLPTQTLNIADEIYDKLADIVKSVGKANNSWNGESRLNTNNFPSSNVSQHLNNTWPVSNNVEKEVTEDQSSPVFYSGIIKKTSKPIAATISRPSSRNENLLEQFPASKDFSANSVSCKRKLSVDFDTDSNVSKSKKYKSVHADSNNHTMKQVTPIASPTKINIFKGNPKFVRDTYNIYKCDFCKFVCYDTNRLSQHLNSSRHLSGSLFRARNIENGIELVCTIQMLAVRNNTSKIQCFIVSCPECHELFDNIFSCGLHSKHMHNFESGVYCISPVINVLTVSMNKNPLCTKCGQLFQSHNALVHHWKVNKNHSPAPDESNSNVFTLVICPYCQVTFKDDFLMANMHVVQQHWNEIKGTKFNIELKVIVETRKHEKLPVFDECCMPAALQTELSVLKKIESQMFMTQGSAGKRKLIKMRIAEISSELKN